MDWGTLGEHCHAPFRVSSNLDMAQDNSLYSSVFCILRLVRDDVTEGQHIIIWDNNL